MGIRMLIFFDVRVTLIRFFFYKKKFTRNLFLNEESTVVMISIVIL